MSPRQASGLARGGRPIRRERRSSWPPRELQRVPLCDRVLAWTLTARIFIDASWERRSGKPNLACWAACNLSRKTLDTRSPHRSLWFRDGLDGATQDNGDCREKTHARQTGAGQQEQRSPELSVGCSDNHVNFDERAMGFYLTDSSPRKLSRRLSWRRLSPPT